MCWISPSPYTRKFYSCNFKHTRHKKNFLSEYSIYFNWIIFTTQKINTFVLLCIHMPCEASFVLYILKFNKIRLVLFIQFTQEVIRKLTSRIYKWKLLFGIIVNRMDLQQYITWLRLNFCKKKRFSIIFVFK